MLSDDEREYANQLIGKRIHALDQLELYYLREFCEDKEEGSEFDRFVCDSLSKMRQDIRK